MKRIIIKVNQGRNYLFSTATKPIQFLNTVLTICFGLVYLINGASLNQLKACLNFSYVGSMWIWWLVVFLGYLKFKYMRRDTLDSNIRVHWLFILVLLCGS